MNPLVERDTGSTWLRRVSLLSLAFVGGLAACAFDLSGDISCGDGWWDERYEPCDPSAANSPHIDACRQLDPEFDVDGVCDPVTCELIASPETCNVCGDGVAAGNEACDGLDLRGQTCSDVGTLRCNEDCTLDYDGCAAVCGDGVVSITEECDPELKCATDSDCGPNMVCYEVLGECISTSGENFAPQLACSSYQTLAPGFEKAYSSGTIGACSPSCVYGRDGCGFCGDGQLDNGHSDISSTGQLATFPAEFCDGDDIRDEDIFAHCEDLCTEEPVNIDVSMRCDFECAPDCRDFAPTIIPNPTPEAINCCLAKGSPCPQFDSPGVPDLPCCAWLDNPEWAADQKCVHEDTGVVPLSLVCP